MGAFTDLRTRLGAEYREAVGRRVYTVTGTRPDDAVVDAMIASGESEAVFQKAILEQGRGHVVDTLADVQDRHEAVRELEASLLDLHQVRRGGETVEGGGGWVGVGWFGSGLFLPLSLSLSQALSLSLLLLLLLSPPPRSSSTWLSWWRPRARCWTPWKRRSPGPRTTSKRA